MKYAYIQALYENYEKVVNTVELIIQTAPSPSTKAVGYAWKGFYLYWFGSLNEALAELKKAEKLWEEVDYKRALGFVDWMRAWIYFEQGNMRQSHKFFESWFKIYTEYYPMRFLEYSTYYNFWLGLTNLMAGELSASKTNLDEIRSHLQSLENNRETRLLQYNSDKVYHSYEGELQYAGLSVRCLKD